MFTTKSWWQQFKRTLPSVSKKSRRHRRGEPLQRAVMEAFEPRLLMDSAPTVGEKLLEALSVSSLDSAVSSSLTLQTGIEYQLRVTGTLMYQPFWGGYADAEYAYNNVQVHDVATSGVDYGISVTTDGTTPLGNSTTKAFSWGSANADRVYYHTVTGSGHVLKAIFNDDFYDDNIGSLTLEIWGPSQPQNNTQTCPPPLSGQSSASSSPTAPFQSQNTGVNLATGAVSVNAPSYAASTGMGKSWSPALSWTNDGGYSNGAVNGNGFVDASLPSISKLADGSVIAVDNAGSAKWFDLSSSTFTERFGGHETLTIDSGSGDYIRTDPNGATTRYYGFGSGTSSDLRGRFQSYTDASGTTMTATYAGSSDPYYLPGQLKSVSRSFVESGQTKVESYVYTYVNDGGMNSRKIASVTLSRKIGSGSFTGIRTTEYAYYDGAYTLDDDDDVLDSRGNAGDLKTVTQRDGSGNAIDKTWYRYYTTINPTGGYVGGIKYVFSSDSYKRLVAEYGSDPEDQALSDSDVNAYADQYFEYDSLHRVTRTLVQGAGCSCPGSTGQGDFTYTYATNSSYSTPADVNNTWLTKTTENRYDKDSNLLAQTVTYMNAAGQTMLTDYKDVTDSGNASLNNLHWLDYYKYNSDGRLVLHAQPSAVTSISESDADLVGFNSTTGNYVRLADAAGEIEYFDYYTLTDASSSAVGGVDGYVKDTYITHGDGNGTATRHFQSFTDYIADAEGSTYFVADSTVYALDVTSSPGISNSGARNTHFDYSWYSSTDLVQSITVTMPTVSTGENGPNTGDVIRTYNDEYGRAIWSMDGDGYITYAEYDNTTGAVKKTIVDFDYGANTALQSLFPTLTGWSYHSSGLNLVTTYGFDALGRTTKIVDPKGKITYIVYNDVNHEIRTYHGWNSTTKQPATPVEVVHQDQLGGYTETLKYTWTSSSGLPIDGNGVPTGAEDYTDTNVSHSSYSTLQSLTRVSTNSAGQVIEKRSYFKLGGLAYTTDWDMGTVDVNYYSTSYDYNAIGLMSRVKGPTQTITRTIYDNLGRIVSTWIGTDDSPTTGYWSPTNTASTDMTKTIELEYDNGGVGDSNLTRTISYLDYDNARATDYRYDWRDRLVLTKEGIKLHYNSGNSTWTPVSESTSDNSHPITYLTYDNLDEVLSSEMYDGDTFATGNYTDGVPNAPSTSLRRALTAFNYDEQGRIYKSIKYSISTSTGNITTNTSSANITIESNTWYDHRGNILASRTDGNPTIINKYDGVGRLTVSYTTDGGAVANSGTPLTTWSSYGNVSTTSSVNAFIVLEQSAFAYDSSGNLIETATAQRFHNDSATASGSLFTVTLNSSGSLDITKTGSLASRIYYSANYYDAANRLVASVTPGTNTGSAYTPATSTPTGTSSTLLTSLYTYNSAGYLDTITDPRGKKSKTYYDNLGRTLFSVAGWDGSYDPTASGAKPPTADKNLTTGYTYDGSNHVVTLTAVTATGSNNQTTHYVYGTQKFLLVSPFTGDSYVSSNDLLRRVEYPEPSNGNASTTSAHQSSFSYFANGELREKIDQNGTSHLFTRDSLGRVIEDAATIAGGNPQGIDTTVKAIRYTYNTQGLLSTINSIGEGMDEEENPIDITLNGVARRYNGFGQLTREFQEHNGAAITGTSSTSLSVQYTYDDAAGHSSRLLSISYPTNRTISYNYGTGNGLNDSISRLTSIKDGNLTVESYEYLGLSTVVERSQGETGIKLTFVNNGTSTGDAGDQYTGLDRFGRVVDQRWMYGNGTDVDRFKYTYDEVGNVLSKSDMLSSYGTSAETYTYDDLNRLVQTDRPNNTSAAYQTWTLDSLGNMDSVTTAGTTDSRTNDDANRLMSMGGGNLTYDNNGNAQTDDHGNTLVYDAWNRLVSITHGTTSQTYTYDGLGRRITEARAANDHGDSTTPHELYYSSSWQVIEEDVEGDGLELKTQYVWSPVYVDALVFRDYHFWAGTTGNTTFALNERTYVTQDANHNVTSLLSARTGSADLNQDGIVDIADLSIVADNWQADVSGGDASGDLNHDGKVDLADLTIVANNSGATYSTSSTWLTVEHFVYDAYGKFTTLARQVDNGGNWTNTWGTASEYLAWNYLHQGGRYDWYAGLYDFRNRGTYSPTAMRWLQPEPSGAVPYIDGLNLHQYVHDTPMTAVDPFGREIINSTMALNPIRYTQPGETFIRYESGNPAFTRVTPSGGLTPGTYAAPAGEGVLPQGSLNGAYNLPNPEITRLEYRVIQPPSGTPVIGPRSVVGGSGLEVIFPAGAGSGSVGPALSVPSGYSVGPGWTPSFSGAGAPLGTAPLGNGSVTVGGSGLVVGSSGTLNVAGTGSFAYSGFGTLTGGITSGCFAVTLGVAAGGLIHHSGLGGYIGTDWAGNSFAEWVTTPTGADVNAANEALSRKMWNDYFIAKARAAAATQPYQK